MATQTRSQTDGHVSFEIPVPTFVTEGIETGRARLKDLETQAQELIRDLYARGNKEFDDLKGRLPLDTFRDRLPLDRLPIDDLADRAKGLETQTRTRAVEVAADLERRLQDIQDKTLGLIGVASRDQVQSLAADIDRLARRVDSLTRATKAKATKAPKAKATKAPKAKATKTKAPKTKATKTKAPKAPAKKAPAKRSATRR